MIPEIKPYLHFAEFISQFKKIKNPIEKLEEKFAEFTETNYALYFPMARSGLFTLLKALEIKDKQIILPAYTCLVVPQSIAWSQNRLLFLDNKLDDINMSDDLIMENISDNTPVVLLTSLFGRKHDPGIIEKIKSEYQGKYRESFEAAVDARVAFLSSLSSEQRRNMVKMKGRHGRHHNRR